MTSRRLRQKAPETVSLPLTWASPHTRETKRSVACVTAALVADEPVLLTGLRHEPLLALAPREPGQASP